MKSKRWFVRSVFALALLAPANSLRAELVISQLVVELQAGKQIRQDVELLNSGTKRMYVAVEPREIIAPGTPDETSYHDPDPQKLGLLVAPARVVLEPGQRKLVRVAAIHGDEKRERVYRVTVKPVVGQLSKDQAGLKILIGYDVLVLSRPSTITSDVEGRRAGEALTLRNIGNASLELIDGQECDTAKHCSALAGFRLYAGAEKTVRVSPDRAVIFKAKSKGALRTLEF